MRIVDPGQARAAIVAIGTELALTAKGPRRRFRRMPALLDRAETADTVDAKGPSLAPIAGGAVPVAIPNAARCFHCGRPNPPRTRWHADWDGVSHAFCCAGCLGVARTIRAAGLDDFYERRTPGRRSAADRGRRAATSGRTGTRPRRRRDSCARARDGTREVSLIVEGIHCGACIWLIESWLAREPGVVSAGVNYATRRARVVWDPARTRLSARAARVRRDRLSRQSVRSRSAARSQARGEARALLLRLAVAVLAMMQVMMFAVPTYVTVDGVEEAHRRLLEWASLTLTLPALLYSASPFFRGAWRDLRHRSAGMDVPVALGLAAAFGGSVVGDVHGRRDPVYYDSVTMFIALLLLARYVELVARQRAGAAIEALARARPATAERLLDWPSGQAVETVGAASLAAGDLMLVRPGATVAADGDIVDGRASLEEAMLTGESRPRAAAPGDAVLAGSVARDGALVVRVRAAGEATRLAGLERLAERAMGERPRVARFADRVARWFVAALLVACRRHGHRLVEHRPVARAGGDLRRAGRVVPVRAVARDARRAGGGGGGARTAPCRHRARRCAGDPGARHACGARQDRNADDGTDGARRRRSAAGRRTRDAALALAAALDAVFRASAGARLSRGGARRRRAAEGRRGGDRRRQRRGGHRRRAGACVSGGRISSRRCRGGERRPTWRRPTPPRRTSRWAMRPGSSRCSRSRDTLRPGAADCRRRGWRASGSSRFSSRATGPRASRRSRGRSASPMPAATRSRRTSATPSCVCRTDGAVVAMVGDGINDAPSLAQAQVSVTLGSATPLAQRTADIVVLGDDLVARAPTRSRMRGAPIA